MIYSIMVHLQHVKDQNLVRVNLSRDEGTTWSTILSTQINGTWKRYLKDFLWLHLLTSRVQLDEFIAQVENSV